MKPPPSSRDCFRFAIICALPLEFDAVHESLDEIWKDLHFSSTVGDPNSYTMGRIGKVPIVLLLLPEKGKVAATSAAASLRSTYNKVTTVFVVGICGAVPNLLDGTTEILLGDVIISKYVVQYDLGAEYPDGFRPKKSIDDILGRPNKETRILNAQLETRSSRDELETMAQQELQTLQLKVIGTKYRGIYDYLGAAHDKLFNSQYRHKHHQKDAVTVKCDICSACREITDPICEESMRLPCWDLGCSDTELVARNRLLWDESSKLVIYVGGIGSADTVLKSGTTRDRLAQRDRVIGFEMEGAGVWDELPSCLVVKGVCDYADSHKPKQWQNYAAATAASTTKALVRLYFQDDTRAAEQQSIIQGRVFFVPFSENEDFIGRSGIIESLVEILSDDNKKNKNRVALVGIGGVGKTQILLKVAYMMKSKDLDRNVFWLPAYSMEAFEQACASCIEKLKLSRNEGDDPKEVFQRYLDSENMTRWVLILDNADNEEILRGSGGGSNLGIYKYLPRSSQNGQILLTTRWRQIAVDFAKTDTISVTEMDYEEAKNMLLSSLISQDSMRDNNSIPELLQLLACLPLAIAQAAAYINIFQISIEEYLLVSRNSQRDMMDLMRKEHVVDTLYTESQYAVATTWLTSFKQLEKQNKVAIQLLHFIMWIQPQAIPQSILPNLGSEQEMIKAIGLLKSYGFLRARPERGMFDMHSLVHLVMQSWAYDQNIDGQTKTEMLTHMNKIFQSDDWETRDIWRAQLPHVIHIFHTYQETDPIAVSELGFWAGGCLEVDSRTSEAIAILQQVIKIQISILPEHHLDLQLSQKQLAISYHHNGQIKDAFVLLEQVLKIQESTLAKDHHLRLSSQHELARLYVANGQAPKAIALLEDVVNIRNITLAEENPNRLVSQYELARAYRSNNQTQKAIKLLEYIIGIQQRTPSTGQLNQLAVQHELAQIYRINGRLKEAISLLEYIVKIHKEVLAIDHYHLLTSQCTLATAYSTDGQTRQAIVLLEHIIKMQERSLPEGHRDRLISQNSLAQAYKTDGRIQEAILLFEHVIRVQQDTLPEAHEDLLVSQHSLAQAYKQNGQIEEALILINMLLKLDKQYYRNITQINYPHNSH